MSSNQSGSFIALLKRLSCLAIIVSAISIAVAIVSSGDLYKFSVIVFGVSMSFVSLMTAVICISLKTVPGASSEYGYLDPTPWKDKPVQFVLCIALFVSVAVLMLLMTLENYRAFFPD